MSETPAMINYNQVSNQQTNAITPMYNEPESHVYIDES
jgi:hypothetical protein